MVWVKPMWYFKLGTNIPSYPDVFECCLHSEASLKERELEHDSEHSPTSVGTPYIDAQSHA